MAAGIPTNSELADAIKRPENAWLLHQVLDARGREFTEACARTTGYAIQGPLSEGKVEELLSHVTPMVQRFLGIYGFAPPAAKFSPSVDFCQFDPVTGSVEYSERLWRLPPAATLGHEVGHMTVGVVHPNTMLSPQAFHEGIAIGVERHVRALTSALPEQDSMLAGLRLRDRRVACAVMDRDTDPMRLATPSTGSPLQHVISEGRGSYSQEDIQRMGTLYEYGIGEIIFAIAEAKHGPGIYAAALRDPRVVLR